ncbi:hypothetical protein A9K55_007208 [Cordyceps militaris]|uniref:Ankyrin repeat-containing domain n=1 Tax=Cordyceps militaris TaxID=73501 RepID=A0A2H4SJK3_CORMI|nr:hypothetical protein A9K55_007208 [Cordyceps militaris]
MAEVVGVVAAGFAFGEVALKMSAHVFKLKHMWEDMKEIPDHVRMLVHEIELLSRVLHEMEADLNSPSQDGASWGGIGVLIVSICRSAVDVLDASVNAVSQELASVRGVRRTMRKVKLVLKKDFWSKIENRLQHVVGLLGIAQQYWLRSLTQRQPDVIVSRLQLLQGAVQPDHIDNSTGTLQDKDKTPGPRPKAMKYSTDRRGQLMQKHRGSSWLGSVGLDWTQSRDDNQGTAGGCNTYYMQLKPPNWLTRKAWSVVSSLSVSGFDITLRAYSVVPRNSPVMECAAVGDVGGLLDLFDKGLASPFDIDPDGNGLLEV